MLHQIKMMFRFFIEGFLAFFNMCGEISPIMWPFPMTVINLGFAEVELYIFLLEPLICQ